MHIVAVSDLADPTVWQPVSGAEVMARGDDNIVSFLLTTLPVVYGIRYETANPTTGVR